MTFSVKLNDLLFGSFVFGVDDFSANHGLRKHTSSRTAVLGNFLIAITSTLDVSMSVKLSFHRSRAVSFYECHVTVNRFQYE